MERNQWKQENIRLGTHGEDYGSWMSNPVFYIIGGIGVLTAVLAVLSFYVLHVAVLGVLFTVITVLPYGHIHHSFLPDPLVILLLPRCHQKGQQFYLLLLRYASCGR